MFVSATVQKPVFVENKTQAEKIKVNICSTQIDFTNLYVASLVYLSRIICAFAPIPKHDCPRMYFLSAIFPQQKSKHSVISSDILVLKIILVLVFIQF